MERRKTRRDSLRETITRASRLFTAEAALAAEAWLPLIDPKRWRKARGREGRGPRDEADFAFVEFERRK